MKNRSLNLIILLTILIVFVNSCSNQRQSKKIEQIVAENQSIKINDTIKLKFTSGIRSILEDSKGNIWFGSHQEGLAKLDGNQFTYYTKNEGLSDMQIRSIYEYENGEIWFEGGEGLSRFDGKKISVQTNKNFDTQENWKLNNSYLWFKGDKVVGYNELEGKPGVYQYDGNEIAYRAFPIKPKKGEENYYSITTPFVKSKKGSIWFGTYGAAIEFNGSVFNIIDNEFLSLNDKTGFLHIRSLMEDSKGNIWIGNNGIGVFKFNGKEWINFTIQNNLNQKHTNGKSLDRVFAIGEDKLGNIWFGTAESGVWKYNGNTIVNFSKEYGLESTHIGVIYEANNGELWFGGASPSGVYIFNGTSFERKY